MTYTDMIESEIRTLGYSTGFVSVERAGLGRRWVAEAHKDGVRHQAEAEDLLTAFIQLKKSIKKPDDYSRSAYSINSHS